MPVISISVLREFKDFIEFQVMFEHRIVYVVRKTREGLSYPDGVPTDVPQYVADFVFLYLTEV